MAVPDLPNSKPARHWRDADFDAVVANVRARLAIDPVTGNASLGSGTLTAGKVLVAPGAPGGMDTSSAGALALGVGTATEVDLGKTGVPAKVYGPLTAGLSQLNPVIAAAETNPGTSCAHNTSTRVQYNTVVHDTHSALTTGASWHFTAPLAGYYSVTAVATLGVVSALGLEVYLSVFKNGVEKYRGNAQSFTTAGGWPGGSGFQGPALSACLYLAASDQIDVRIHPATSSGVAVTLTTQAVSNHIEIVRIGGS